MDIKDLIKKKRIEKQLTMKELANLIGVSEGTISRWESGEISNMKRSAIVSLSKELDIPPATLMGWDEKEDASTGYYNDPEVAALAEELRTNPEMKILFSASKNLTKDQMQDAYDYVKYLKSKERSDHSFVEDTGDRDFTEDTDDGDFTE